MKPTRTARPLGRRTLRLGARGERVHRLQQQLRNLGYDPGPLDGLYGHLTFAAVRELQKDFRMPADGTAGPRVLQALSDEQLMNVHRRIVIAELEPSISPGMAARVLQRNATSLSGIALPVRAGDGEAADQSDEPKLPVRLSSANPITVADKDGMRVWHTLHTRVGHNGSLYEIGRLQRLLHDGVARGRLEQQAIRLLTLDAEGNLYLDLGPMLWGDGGRVVGMLRTLSRHARRHRRELIVSVPLRIDARLWSRVFKEVDPSALATLATRIVLVPPVSVSVGRRGGHRPKALAIATSYSESRDRPLDQALADRPIPYGQPPSLQQLSTAIREIVQVVPPWRCLLMVPVGAVVLSPDHPPEVLPYQHALALAYNNRTRPRWDATIGRPMYYGTYKNRHVSVWLENRYSLLRKLDIVDHRRLAGVYLCSIGLEDARIWGVLRERWQVARPSDR